MFKPSPSDIEAAELVRDGDLTVETHLDISPYVNHGWIEAAERLSGFVLACRDASEVFEKLHSGEMEVVQ